MSLLPQFGFLELVLIAVVALVVVGPKDLPKLMRSAGRLVAKARAMAGEFTAAFDQMAREAEMEDLRKEIDELKKNNPAAAVKREVEEAFAPVNAELRKEEEQLKAATKAAESAEQEASSKPADNEPAKS